MLKSEYLKPLCARGCFYAFLHIQTRVRARARVRACKGNRVRMTSEECILDAIAMARSRVFRKDAYSVSLYISPPALPPRASFLVPSSCGTSLKFMDYSHGAREDGGSGGRLAGWFDKSLLVKRLPDCRERERGTSGGEDVIYVQWRNFCRMQAAPACCGWL